MVDTEAVNVRNTGNLTITALLDKINKILATAKDSDFLSRDDVCCLKNCWKAIWYAKQLKNE